VNPAVAVALAVGMVRSWVALYTLGLAAELRRARRLEIDCDLWEQRQLAGYMREPPLRTAAEIVARAVLGMLSDITWRVQAGLSAHTDRSLRMNEPLPMRALVLLAIAVAAFPAVIGSLVLVGANGEMDGTERALFGPLQIAIGVVIICGLAMSQRRPVLGIGLVATGTIAISGLWYWAAMITIPAGLVLIAIAYFRCRGTRGAQPRGTGAA